MANIKISELTALTPPAAADLVPVTDSNASQTKRTTVGEIVGIINGDVDVADDGAATISELPVSKLQDGAARQLLQTDAAGTGVEWTDDVDIPGTLDVTGIATLDGALNATGLASLDGGIDVDGAFTVADATGNVSTSGTLGVTGQSTLASAAVSDLTSGRVVLAGTSGELEDNAGLTFNGTQLDVNGDVIITGDLTVEGTTTTIESQTLTVKDKNIELGVVASPTDVTADGGGITLKGATDKTINWLDSTDAWTLSEHVSIASAKEYRINGTKVLDATSLGSAVVSSSLTSVGTIGTGVWNGTAIATAYIADSAITSAKIADGAIVNADINASAAIADTKLGTISTAGKVSNSATTATNANTASAIVARDASGDFTAGTITAALTGNADTATALSSARTFAVTGDVTGTVSSDLTSGASIATSIASGVIVDGDVNASAAIAGTKISPDFGSQAVTTTGLISAGGKVSFPLGTAALPSLYPASDTNTGIHSPGADELAISTNGTERLRIDSSGRLLVGTSTALSNLSYEATLTLSPQIQLIGSTASTAHLGIVRTSGAGPSDLTLGWGSDGNVAASNQDIGALLFSAFDGSVYRNAAYIQCEADGVHAAGDTPGRLVFSTTADGAASPTEALRISNDRSIKVSDGGDVVLGTTTGTKIGTATSQKIGFYNATPVVQPTTGVAEAAFVENSGGTAVNVDSTFGGYTIQQVVEALQTLGLLA
jgi:hypothetical protein